MQVDIVTMVKFDTLSIGDTFAYGRKYCMKTERIINQIDSFGTIKKITYNAINLETGMHEIMLDSEYVTPVKMKMVKAE